MAEETTTKKASTRKPKTTKAVEKSVEEPVVDMNAMAQQMQQMMAIMAQQQQMIAQLSQQAQVQPVEKYEVAKETKQTNPRVRKTFVEKGMTKQALRRKYKDTEIYLVSVFSGSVAFVGKNETYTWNQYGDVQPISISDLILMSSKPVYLQSPWLMLDEYENDEETLDDIISCLNLEKHYRKLYILQEMEENINGVDLTELANLVAESDVKGGTLSLDVTAIVQNKIASGELDNYRLVNELERIVGRTFNK